MARELNNSESFDLVYHFMFGVYTQIHPSEYTSLINFVSVTLNKLISDKGLRENMGKSLKKKV